MSATPPRLFLVAGEKSGDDLGAPLMRALRAMRDDISFAGVGGPSMQAQGLTSLFPMADIAVNGFLPVIARLPTLVRRIRDTATAAIAFRPDALVIIDSPDFTHRVARRVRTAAPNIPVVDYVSPTVWAWRPGRAAAMRAYIDEVLAILPFEPAAHARLGGPRCVYIGHPLTERLATLRPSTPTETDARANARQPMILILPGSRRSEIARLLAIFGEAAGLIAAELPGARFVLPAVEHLAETIRGGLASWVVKPEIVLGEPAKLAAFRSARAALAASGTVTLELALAGVPTVLAYRASAIEEKIIRAVIQVDKVGLPNLILDRFAIPEFIQQNCTAANLARAMLAVVRDGEARAAQLSAFAEVEQLMSLPPGETPSGRAAREILALAAAGRG